METIRLIITMVPEMLTTVYWFKAAFIASAMYIYLNYWINKNE